MTTGGADDERRLPATVVALGFTSLLADVSSEMVYTQTPILLTSILGAPASVVGLVEGLAESTASLARLPAGWLSDRIGRRLPLAAAGYGLAAFAKPLIGLARTWPLVLLWRFADRLGKGVRTAPRDALITEAAPSAMRGRAFGLHRSMDSAGAVIGPLLGYAFLRLTGGSIRDLFVFAGIPGLLSVVAILAFVKERPHAPAHAHHPKRPIFKWSALDANYRRFLIAMLVFNLGNSSDAFLVLKARHAGVGAAELLLIYGAFNVVEVLFAYAVGHLSDHIGRRPLLAAGLAVFSVVYAGFALAHGRTAIWSLFIAYGAYYTLTQGTARAFAADHATAAARAGEIAAYHTVVGIAVLPASLIAGFMFRVSVAAPFWYGSLMALAGMALLPWHRTPRAAEG